MATTKKEMKFDFVIDFDNKEELEKKIKLFVEMTDRNIKERKKNYFPSVKSKGKIFYKNRINFPVYKLIISHLFRECPPELKKSLKEKYPIAWGELDFHRKKYPCGDIILRTKEYLEYSRSIM